MKRILSASKNKLYFDQLKVFCKIIEKYILFNYIMIVITVYFIYVYYTRI